MEPKGSARAQFARAVELGHLLSAESAARELGRLSLADALALTLLMHEQAPDRFPRAAARWHARLVLEARGVGVGDSQLALAAVAALPDAGAAKVLGEIARRYRVPNVDRVLGPLVRRRR